MKNKETEPISLKTKPGEPEHDVNRFIATASPEQIGTFVCKQIEGAHMLLQREQDIQKTRAGCASMIATLGLITLFEKKVSYRSDIQRCGQMIEMLLHALKQFEGDPRQAPTNKNNNQWNRLLALQMTTGQRHPLFVDKVYLSDLSDDTIDASIADAQRMTASALELATYDRQFAETAAIMQNITKALKDRKRSTDNTQRMETERKAAGERLTSTESLEKIIRPPKKRKP